MVAVEILVPGLVAEEVGVLEHLGVGVPNLYPLKIVEFHLVFRRPTGSESSGSESRALNPRRPRPRLRHPYPVSSLLLQVRNPVEPRIVLTIVSPALDVRCPITGLTLTLDPEVRLHSA